MASRAGRETRSGWSRRAAVVAAGALAVAGLGMGVPAQARTGMGGCDAIRLKINTPNSGPATISTVAGGLCGDSNGTVGGPVPGSVSGTITSRSCGELLATVTVTVGSTSYSSVPLQFNLVEGPNYRMQTTGGSFMAGGFFTITGGDGACIKTNGNELTGEFGYMSLA